MYASSTVTSPASRGEFGGSRRLSAPSARGDPRWRAAPLAGGSSGEPLGHNGWRAMEVDHRAPERRRLQARAGTGNSLAPPAPGEPRTRAALPRHRGANLASAQSRYSGVGGLLSRTSMAAGSRHLSVPSARGNPRGRAALLRRQTCLAITLFTAPRVAGNGDGQPGLITSSAAGPRRAWVLSCAVRMPGATLQHRAPTGSRVDLVSPLVTLLGTTTSRRASGAARGVP
jgi:hypothetical protein